MGRPIHELSIREMDQLEADLSHDEGAVEYEVEDAIFTLIEKRYPSRKPTELKVKA